MMKVLFSIIGASAFVTDAVFAVEPVELTPKEAVRLIVIKSDVLETTVEIPFILDGTAKNSEDFEASHVRRVAAIHPVRDGASQSRKLVFYDLYWNESLGWFMWESRPERAGEAVYIWSQLRGRIVNR